MSVPQEMHPSPACESHKDPEGSTGVDGAICLHGCHSGFSVMSLGSCGSVQPCRWPGDGTLWLEIVCSPLSPTADAIAPM